MNSFTEKEYLEFDRRAVIDTQCGGSMFYYCCIAILDSISKTEFKKIHLLSVT